MNLRRRLLLHVQLKDVSWIEPITGTRSHTPCPACPLLQTNDDVVMTSFFHALEMVCAIVDEERINTFYICIGLGNPNFFQVRRLGFYIMPHMFDPT
jgi:hypothetical protein